MKKRHYLIIAFLLAIVGWGGFSIGQSSHKSEPKNPVSHKPLIGISNQTDSSYVRAVHQAGGIPIILPVANGSSSRIDEYLEFLDGLLMPGGADIPPSEYGEKIHPTTKLISDDRFHFEKALINAWIKKTNKPLLGICLGSQWICVAHGGSLVQDIPSEFNLNHRISHQVTLEADSKLKKILGDSSFQVNSQHHQAVRTVGKGLRIVGKCPDSIIEAIETTDPDRFLIGVQWHPERMIADDPRQQKLFTAFIKAANAK